MKVSRFAATSLFVLSALSPASTCFAHVTWTRANAVAGTGAPLLALYHFGEDPVSTGTVFANAAGLNSAFNMTLAAPTSGPGFASSTDLVGAFLGTHSLALQGNQRADSPAGTGVLWGGQDDCTVEFWFKWGTDVDNDEIQVGLRSAVKIWIRRDQTTPANDRFGIATTHGDTAQVPGFTDWVAVGATEAPLDEWLHVGVTVHSTGYHLDIGLNHEVWDAGSTATVYLNGHAAGTGPIDLTGVRGHPDTRVSAISLSGSTLIDELSIWGSDLSANGTITTMFNEGRDGVFSSAVSDWQLY